MQSVYSAAPTDLTIILISTRFATSTNLDRAISRHQIILDFPRFATFAVMVQPGLFFTSQPWVVWRKANAQSRVTSRCSSAHFRSFLFFPGVDILLSLYNFLDAHAILVVTRPTCVKHEDTFPVYNASNTTHAALLLRKRQHCIYLRKQFRFLLCHIRNLLSMSKLVVRSVFSILIYIHIYKSFDGCIFTSSIDATPIDELL